MHWCWVKIMVCTFYLNGVVKSLPYIAYKRHQLLVWVDVI